MVSLGQDLGLRVVAEGIEEHGQLQYLRSIGCHSAQGHLFSPALEPAGLERFLDSRAGEAFTPTGRHSQVV